MKDGDGGWLGEAWGGAAAAFTKIGKKAGKTQKLFFGISLYPIFLVENVTTFSVVLPTLIKLIR